MSRSQELENKFRAMTTEQKLLAYAKAKLAAAKYRDSKFRHEHNESNFWYDAMIEYAYGSGER